MFVVFEFALKSQVWFQNKENTEFKYKLTNGVAKNCLNLGRGQYKTHLDFRICKHWTRSLFPQLTTTNRLHVYWWNRWNRPIWIFPSIPNTDTMYINCGAIHVHSATGVLTVRGGKQFSLRGGGLHQGWEYWHIPS